ncbi:heterokaryon incompatibility protein-domain-containing protein [Lenzites betulinus]|nr:heterokaryon incompatibility protein-domain-containing protein [Lenzites betulinus]
MPRFLNTWTGEFEWHHKASDIRYAILSHTWRSPQDGGEQIYDDVRSIHAEIADYQRGMRTAIAFKSSSDPQDIVDVLPLFFYHPRVSEKIISACKVARDAGFRLLWIDACCIDKTSSAELAEAINSMYEWYRLSEICYAFLEDVPDDDDPTSPESAFRKSRWHTRGWTLQELIAPLRVVFLTKRWSFLGSKMGLAATLESVTHINVDILTGRVPMDSVSVARRMSWAVRRYTTRVEDYAYSLLGIFGVHMAPIYGEGANAFLRLQDEILRTVPDQTIFAHEWETPLSIPGLLASSPAGFSSSICRSLEVISSASFASRLRIRAEEVPPLQAVLTPQGVRMSMLCIRVDLARSADLAIFVPELARNLTAIWAACNACAQLPRAHLLAILRCKTSDGLCVVLPLHRPPPGPEEEKGLWVGTGLLCVDHNHVYPPFRRHILTLSERALAEVLAPPSLRLSTVEVSILRHSPIHAIPRVVSSKQYIGSTVSSLAKRAPEDTIEFEFDPICVQELDKLGFYLSRIHIAPPTQDNVKLSFTLSSQSVCRPWSALLPRQTIAITLSFTPRVIVSRRISANAKVVVSITNSVAGPPDTLGTDPTLPSDSPFALPSSVIVDEPSGAYLSEGVSTFEYRATEPITALAIAEFAVYAGMPAPDREPGPFIRRLRLSLQLSMGSLERRPHYDCVQIVVEMSDIHVFVKPRSTHAPTDVPSSRASNNMDSKPKDAHGAGLASAPTAGSSRPEKSTVQQFFRGSRRIDTKSK